jgi:hypothetical protein
MGTACCLVALLVSCIEVIEIPEDFYTDHIIINSILDMDSINAVHVSKGLPPVGKIVFEFVDHANIQIGEVGIDQSIGFNFFENGWYVSSELLLEPMKKYSLLATIPDFSDISAYTVIPKKPNLSDVQISSDSIFFSIVDDPNIAQYYLVTLMGYPLQSERILLPDSTYDYVSQYKYKPLRLQSDDASIDAYLKGRVGHVNKVTGLNFNDQFWDLVPDYTGDSFLFSDQTFQGETREFTMKITDRGFWFIDSIKTVDLLVQAIDYNYYQYLLTFAQYWTTDEAPFTNRAKIFSNIEGGYGIFGSKNGVKVELELPDELF